MRLGAQNASDSRGRARELHTGAVGCGRPEAARPPVSSVLGEQRQQGGLYVVATDNKEDVVVTKVPWDSLLAELE